MAVRLPVVASTPIVSDVAAGLAVDLDTGVEVTGPVARYTITLTLRNQRPDRVPAHLELALPDELTLDRVAVEVESRWFDGEVVARPALDAESTLAAVSLARPLDPRRVAPPVARDQVVAVEGGWRRWRIALDALAGHDARRLRLTCYGVVAAAPGTLLIEATAAPDGRVVAAVPRFDRAVAGPPPARVVVALDTSLSMGTAGLAEAVAMTRAIARLHPALVLVHGDLDAHACADDVESCVAGLDPGGATDLGALLAVAFRAAGDGPAAIVLITDGRLTRGDEAAALRGLVAARIAAAPVALHTRAIGEAEGLAGALLEELARAGRGTDHGDLTAALAGPRRARIEVAGATDVEVEDLGDTVVVVGHPRAGARRLVVTRTDDVGASTAVIELGPVDATGDDLARWHGARRRGRAVLSARPGRELDAVDDRDRDGLLDLDDGCPFEAADGGRETFAGSLPSRSDRPGCPLDRRSASTEGPDVFADPRLEPVPFPTGSARIPRHVAAQLDRLAAALVAEASAGFALAVEGTGDGRAGEGTALGLRRAAAVRAALIARGVDAAQVVALALGPRLTRDGGHVDLRILGEVRRGDLRPEEVEAQARVTGTPIAQLEAQLVQRAQNLQGPMARAALARALAATADPAARLAVFDDRVAAAWPREYQAVVVDAAKAGVGPGDRDADRYFDALARSPLRPRRAAAATLVAERWVQTLGDADARWRLPPRRVNAAGAILDWLGRTAEAARLRSELEERARP